MQLINGIRYLILSNRFTNFKYIHSIRNVRRGPIYRRRSVPNQKYSQTSTPKILITNKQMPSVGLDLIKKRCNVIFCEKEPTSRSEILSKIAGVDGVLWITKQKLDKEVLDAAGKQLKVISVMWVGYEHIDVEEVKKRDIAIGYTPYVSSDAIADVAIGLMIAASRRFHECRLKIDQNTWKIDSRWLLGQDITLKTFGIVGLGVIGQTIAHRLSGFTKVNEKPKILYSGLNSSPEGDKLGAIFVTFDQLLQHSDIIFISAPLSHSTYKLFDSYSFKLMKPNSVLVNISRADIIDQDALIDALENERIFAAGLDVMSPEPLPSNHPLAKLTNCVLTPHIGSSTYRCKADMAVLSAVNLLKALDRDQMLTPIHK